MAPFDPAPPALHSLEAPPLQGRLLAISIGRIRPLRHLESAIHKTAVSTLDEPRAVAVHSWGLEGDEQAEKGVHGGPGKAIYMAPVEHWPFWNAERAKRGLPADLHWGFVGENLSVEGLLEDGIHAGDRLDLGEVILEVSEPRIPCLKFNFRMGYAQASRHMLQSGRSGWYCAVLRSGMLQAGVPVRVRPGRRLVSIAGALRIQQGALERQRMLM